MSTLPIAIPGQDLGPISKYLPGPGTHIHNSRVCASVAGPVHISGLPKAAGPPKRLNKITAIAADKNLSTISVLRPSGGAVSPSPRPSNPAETGAGKELHAQGRAEVLPEVNSTVLCRVTRITPRQATVAILAVGETVLDGEWQGIIRVQDVRATEKDRVKIVESFRPGDVVRAVVVSASPSAVSRLCLGPFLPVPSRLQSLHRKGSHRELIMDRYRLATNRAITFLQQEIILASSWRLVRQAAQCIPSAGKSSVIPRRDWARHGRWQSLFRNNERLDSGEESFAPRA